MFLQGWGVSAIKWVRTSNTNRRGIVGAQERDTFFILDTRTTGKLIIKHTKEFSFVGKVTLSRREKARKCSLQ